MNTLTIIKSDVTQELLDLTLSCPVEGGNPSDCQFHHIRNMSPLERFKGMTGLCKQVQKRMINRHSECMAKKQNREGAR
ncbi:MAG: hypothetical protein WCP60_07965 [bacterium]